MKYRILVTGNNVSVIDSFFNQMENAFEALTTSIRYADIIRHVNCCEPDAFVYCLHNESRDYIKHMAGIKYKLAQENIPFILIGSKEECDEFGRIALNVSDLILYRPLSAEAIQEGILKFFGGKKPRQERDVQNDAAKGNNTSAQAGARTPGMASPAGMPFAPGNSPQAGGYFPPGNGGSQNGSDSRRKHILVVDDNSMILRLVKEHLHDKYDVATAPSGKIALKFLQKKKTDLILLDYEMPDENGVVILEKLRASNATKDIPVVFLTGVTESKKIREALAMKPQSYLLKPINRDRLLDTIEKLIG